MDNIRKSQSIIIIFLVIIIAIIAILAFYIIYDVINKEENVILKTNNLLIDLQPNINRKLDVINDKGNNKFKSNNIKITNNGYDANYKIVMSNIVTDDNNIKVSINDNLIRNLSKLNKEDDYYILYDGSLSSGYTAIYNIKLWLIEDNNKNDKYNFKLNVIEY